MLEFSKDTFIGDIQVTRRISEAMIEEVLVNFYECDNSHWCTMRWGQEWEKERPASEPRATWATRKLIDGAAIGFLETEGGETSEDPILTWDLTLDKLLKGMHMWAQDPLNDLDNMDIISYDGIMQYALIGEIEFS